MKKLFITILTLAFFAGGLAGVISPALQNAKAAGDEEDTVYARGGTYVGLVTETINYYDRKESFYMTDPEIPGYSTGYTCGIVAGGNIVAWYNGTSLYELLIPNHTAGQYFWGEWLWGTAGSGMSAMFASLNTDMGATSLGVTISGYRNGMGTYATRQGYTFTSTSIMGTGGDLLDPSYMGAIKSGKLMTIFVDGFTIMDIGDLKTFKASKYDTVIMEQYTGAHVMAIYGYRDVKYYDSNDDIFRHDIYLICHTGFGGTLGMMRVTSHCTLDAAYLTYIT